MRRKTHALDTSRADSKRFSDWPTKSHWLEVVEIESLGLTFLVVRHDQVFGLFLRLTFGLLCLTLRPSLRLFRLLLLACALFLALCESTSRVSGHGLLLGRKIDQKSRTRPRPIFLLYVTGGPNAATRLPCQSTYCRDQLLLAIEDLTSAATICYFYNMYAIKIACAL